MRAERPLRLDNVTCPYCAPGSARPPTTDDHVIGRRMVPKGKLHGQWNLILRACRGCNAHKARLENDLSAISMSGWADVSSRLADARSEVHRKSTSKSARTGKPVSESVERMRIITGHESGLTFDFQLSAPPQADDDRVFELACLHILGFFYGATFDERGYRGRDLPGGFFPVLQTWRGDWGNDVLRAFMQAVVGWTPVIIRTTANGHFKVAVRCHPLGDCWSWALEWNHNIRIIGFAGSEDVARSVFDRFPPLQVSRMDLAPNRYVLTRVETPLAAVDDNLFAIPD